MAGLRERLERRNAGKVARHGGAGGGDATAPAAAAQTRILVTDRVPSKDGLLAELMGGRESAGATRANDASILSLSDASSPWWLQDPPKPNPNLDVLVPLARRALSESSAPWDGLSDLRAAIKNAIKQVVLHNPTAGAFTFREQQDAEAELTALLTGKGPLESLYNDPLVTDIYVDGFEQVRCLRLGQALDTPFRFRSPADYEHFYSAMLRSAGCVVSAAQPVIDCVLSDQWHSRVNALHGSLRAGGEVSLVIRIPRFHGASLYDLIRSQTLNAPIAGWLTEAVSSGEINLLLIGPGGTGKTTLANALLSVVPSDERVLVVEELPEVQVSTCQLERILVRGSKRTRQTHQEVLDAALRRAAHRIVVGEIRGEEAELFVGAAETGHTGSIATMHAQSPEDALNRLTTLITAVGVAPHERVARSVSLVLSMRRIDGRPCLFEVAEVLAHNNGGFVVEPIVRFAGYAGKKRVWRLMSESSPILRRLLDRGVELRTGPTLLPPDDAEPVIEGGAP